MQCCISGNGSILCHSQIEHSLSFPFKGTEIVRDYSVILAWWHWTRVVMRSSSHLVQVLGWWRGREAGPGRGWRGWAACCWSRCGVTAAAGGLLGLLTAHMYVCGAGLDCTIHHTCSCAQVAAAAVIHTAKIEIISLLWSFQRLLCVSYT